MAINDLHHFLTSYFSAHHCSLLYDDANMLTVQLTEKMDRALINRPFYWHYVKQMGFAGEPKQLTVITNPDKRDGKHEWIHYGSPRLQQITNHLLEHEKFTKLYERVNANQKTALYPWLITNIKISYQGKQKKDEIISIGLHLINGAMRLEMMEMLQERSMQNAISDYCYTISPMIKLQSGFRRIENVLISYIQDQDHDWAEASRQRMDEEMNLLRHFYQEEEQQQEMNKEIGDIKKRYSPRISFDVVNGGIFYLTDNQ
ncbi:YqhG family protein [Barrientosiimonas marina]|uniref:YqhG family protein n=1 Tax=Lentibacillus kimchii TaxID=1542911 RepID=A0ABW2V1F9_9BACI